MPKIPKSSQVWVGSTFYFIAFFLLLGLVALAGGNALGQHQGTSPHFLHFSSNLPTNLASTTDPQSAPMTGSMLFEDAEMADITIYVSNQAELYEALEGATGGETILLAPGDYGAVNLSMRSGINIAPTSPITIRSSDPENYASFSELHLNEVSNYTFSNLNFDYSFSTSDQIYFRPFEINNSDSIKILDSVFSGDVASGISEHSDGFGYAIGLSVRGSANIEINSNEFTTWHRAAVFKESDNLLISGNEVHSIRMDGMTFSQISNILIEQNYFHDFLTSPTSTDHCDYIQFWTNGTSEPSTNIVIRENTLDMGDGGAVQSIFMRNDQVDQGFAGLEMYYQNVVIEQNLILGGHLHGITVGETSGLLIQQNTVLAAPNPEASLNVPTIRVSEGSLDVSVLRNAVSNIIGYVDQADWSVTGNAFIQNTDPNSPGYYSDVFVESSMFGTKGVVDYVVAAGSMLDNLQAGYSGLFSFSSNQSVRALFDVSTYPDDEGSLILDGRYSFGSSGASLPAGTTYLWTLDTGETFSGPVLLHRFDSPGKHGVELVVTTPDGSSSIAFAKVSVAGPDLISFEQTTGAFLTYGYGETETILQSDAASAELSSGAFAIELGGLGTQVSVSRNSIERIFGAESFSMTFSIQADTAGSYGELFRLHSSFIASITATGELQFQFLSGSGENIVLKTISAGINDGDIHEISVILDDLDDSLMISVDGSMHAKTNVFGALPNKGFWDLAFGNPWGSKNFDGKILSFDLDVTKNDYSLYSGHLSAAEVEGDLALPVLVAPVEPVEEVTETVDTNIAPIESQPNQTDEPLEEELVELPVYSGDNYVAPVESGSGQTGQPIEEIIVSALPELSGYKLNLANLSDGTEGKLIGNAHVGLVSGFDALVLDGVNDEARLGILEEYDKSSALALEISFARTGLDMGSQSLVSNTSKLDISLVGDSIDVSIGGASSKGRTASFSSNELGILDLESHTLRIVADDHTDRIQMFVDGTLVVDRGDLDFAFDTEATIKNWWSKGWSIGDGGRRYQDFEGVITDFQIDDAVLFIHV